MTPRLKLCVLSLAIVSATASWSMARPASTAGLLAIDSRNNHTCALTAEEGVLCWGANVAGQLGDGTTQERTSPVQVHGLPDDITQIAVGSEHSCALTSGGGLLCWGANDRGQLGDSSFDDRWQPTPVFGLSSGVGAIVAGDYHTCAIMAAAGSLKCWGANEFGQSDASGTGDRTVPTDVCADGACTALMAGVVDVGPGFLHTCAAFEDGSAQCWGHGTFGRLGNGDIVDSISPVDVCADATCAAPLNGVIGIGGGQRHSCAIVTGGGVQCWGWNGAGQLGNGTTDDTSTPVAVTGLASGATSIDVSIAHNCATTSTGQALCWGANDRGQLGNDSTELSSVPVQPNGLDIGVAAIAAGASHSCAISNEEHARCWGYNAFGQVGDGTAEDRYVPTDVDTLSPKPRPTPSATATPTVAPTPTPVPTATPSDVAGDASCDGLTNSIDAAFVLQRAAGLLPSLPCPQNADVNLDGRIDALDAALILQYDAGLLQELPV